MEMATTELKPQLVVLYRLILIQKTLLPIIYPVFVDQPLLGKEVVQMSVVDLNSC